VRVVADEIAAQRTAFGQRHADVRGVVHDVAVREDETVGREGEAAAATAARIDLHHRGAHGVHRADHGFGVRVEEEGVFDEHMQRAALKRCVL